ncbi:MAG: type II secretion system protein GspE, partial [Pseudomonadota bacterium]|nr:type II secretion system protein GspE [Pseudomonadota bacterium]
MSTALQIPYAFAKRNGLVLMDANAAGGSPRLCHRADTPLRALLEARRVVGVPLEMEVVSADALDALLARRYQQSGDATRAAMEDLHDIDLAEIAQQIGEPQ